MASATIAITEAPSSTAEPSRIVLAPLTTVFTPPSSCTSFFIPYIRPTVPFYGFTATTAPTGSALQGVKCSSTFDFVNDGDGMMDTFDATGPLEYDLNCWPPATENSLTSPARILSAGGFYSPGLHCPSGYTTACTAIGMNNTLTTTAGLDGSFSFQFPPVSDETAVGCCPSGLSCFAIQPIAKKYQTCLSEALWGSFTRQQCYQTGANHSLVVSTTTFDVPKVVTQTISVTTRTLSDVFSNRTTSVEVFTESRDVPDSSGPSTLITSDADLQTQVKTFSVLSVFAPLIQLNWKASDVSQSTSSAVTIPVASGPAASGQGKKSGLSGNVKIVVELVAPVVVLAIGAYIVALYLLKTRRRNRTKVLVQAHKSPRSDALGTTAQTLSGTRLEELPVDESYAELEPEERHELLVPYVVHELTVPHVIHERGSSRMMPSTDN
ncbi:MAG: hypothetical protein M1820_004342 [Bogoriella megaspora]|nr:MAG: hypothetical protein M1820_004342 [Bogoriella megaspora]